LPQRVWDRHDSPYACAKVFGSDVFLRSCHDHPTMQKINAMFCAAKSTLDCQQAMLFVALVSGNAHLCLFVPNPVPHRICFVPLYRPGRRINSAPTPRHNLPATMDGCLEHRIEHRTSNIDSTRLDLTCLALHTTRPTCTCACAAQHPARVGIVVGVARSGIIYHVSNPRLGEGEGGRRKTTAKTTTTPSRQHQQPHRPAVCRLLSRPSCP
jgi:hypothetical protein